MCMDDFGFVVRLRDNVEKAASQLETVLCDLHAARSVDPTPEEIRQMNLSEIMQFTNEIIEVGKLWGLPSSAKEEGATDE